jgi:predicted regulator of Ras-like GTPase activity (Roadblock/LC7/MglB family)
VELDEYLKDTVGRVHGAMAAVIFGSDGIAVSHCIGNGGQPTVSISAGGLTNPAAVSAGGLTNPAAVSAGVADLLRMFDDVSAELLGCGSLREITFSTNSFTYVVSRINHEYSVALVLRSEAASGKAKILLRRAVSEIRKEF